MKKMFLTAFIIGAMPLAMMAQDDDLYFVPKKSVDKSAEQFGLPRNTYYEGSNRTIDDYNRRGSYYQKIDGDSISDIIDFSAVTGVYPDSIYDTSSDYQLTRQMSRFDDYSVSDAYRDGYAAGRYSSTWHSPWYYSRYGWYDPWYSWYDPWYYGSYGWGWYDPWYYAGFSPYYYRGWYGYGLGYHGYWGGGYVSRPAVRYQSHRNSFGVGSNSGRTAIGRATGNSRNSSTSGRGSFGASRSTSNYSPSRSYGSGSTGSFGSSGSGSFGGSSSGGSRSSGGGFGRHR